MKKMKLLVCALMVATLAIGVFATGAQNVPAKTKKTNGIILKMTSKKITYKKTTMASKYFGKDAQWEGIIGVGKTKKAKLAKKCKFYYINYKKNAKKVVKTTKKKLMKMLKKDKAASLTENGKSYYMGFAFDITIKKGKVVKIKQVYQA